MQFALTPRGDPTAPEEGARGRPTAWVRRPCRWRASTFVPCASSTPPTGTSGGPSTARACSAHQAAYVDHLLDVVESEQVDLVVVAGDVYDRALPPVDAVRLADETFARLAASRAQVVVTSGNHDSAQRLGFGSRLIDAAGVFIRTDAATAGVPVLLDDDHGPVAVYGLPYLDPDTAARAVGLSAPLPRGGPGRGDVPGARRPRRPARRHPLRRAGPRVRRRWRAQRLRARHQRRRRLDRADVALRRRRLHRARPPARPSHADRHDPLQRVPDGLLLLRGRPPQGLAGWSTSTRPGCGRPSSSTRPSRGRWRGSAATSRRCWPTPALAGHESAWVQATLTDDIRPLQAMERLRRRFPHTLVARLRARPDPRDAGAPAARTQGRTDHEIALDFVADLRGTPATDAEAALLLRGLRRLLRRPRRRRPAHRGCGLMRLHHLAGQRLRPVRRAGRGRLRRALRRRPVPAHRRHRRRQDQRPRRGLLRPLRRGARRPAERQAAPLRPGRRRRDARA